MQSGFAAKTTNRAKARPNNIREINNGFEFFSTRLVKNKKNIYVYPNEKAIRTVTVRYIWPRCMFFFVLFFFI